MVRAVQPLHNELEAVRHLSDGRLYHEEPAAIAPVAGLAGFAAFGPGARGRKIQKVSAAAADDSPAPFGPARIRMLGRMRSTQASLVTSTLI